MSRGPPPTTAGLQLPPAAARPLPGPVAEVPPVAPALLAPPPAATQLLSGSPEGPPAVARRGLPGLTPPDGQPAARPRRRAQWGAAAAGAGGTSGRAAEGVGARVAVGRLRERAWATGVPHGAPLAAPQPLAV
ncbi:cyclin-dependent kinase inhibitor 1C-like [Panthera pardus]|uniref:Cyclin-dependent kinase inhibitor 1C-like n=1 Tax=Panthera pardus TaxID=9691 RepID=A0A9W2V7Y0_PANPR|nr:cyclin-dependent kinase inhibitor 1C-like [Panthera pardus]